MTSTDSTSICIVVSAVLVAAFAAGCTETATEPGGPLKHTFTFDSSTEGWSADIADYPVEETAEELEFEFERRPLPDELDREGSGLYVAGLNTPDDLFMFGKRRLTGLDPNTTYAVTFQVDLASDAPSGCVGVGGPPGEAVDVVVGAAFVEPVPVVRGDRYRLNVDKNVHDGEPAEQAAVAEIGDVGNGIEKCTGPVPYRMLSLDNRSSPLEITSDDDGSLWVFVGTDSGFEGKTTLYYDTIDVTLQP